MSSRADKGTLNEFASIGRFMGFEVYEQEAGSELLIGVPEWGASFFLLIQLDENSKPRFKLLETSPDPPAKAEIADILTQVLRSKEINIGQMDTSYQFSKQNLLPDVNIDGAMQISKYQPSNFSSVVDDMFELYKGQPASIGHHSGKRTVSDILKKIQILQDPEESGFIDKTGISAQASAKTDLPSNIYATLLVDVVRHCLLCIKHARLTSQMDAINIQHYEEVALSACPNIYFCLPFAEDISWKHVCLRLGKPGNRSWDVKITDEHFRDLRDLQNGNNNKNRWALAVFVPNTSNIEARIHFDQEGAVISYQSVEPYSIKKLVTDIQSLSSARKFAIRIRKLLLDELPKEGSEVADKLFEQRRKTFKVEAVGLTSLWFSFGSGSDTLARVAVHWESEKQGSIVHVSPDHLWPHTKFLEDFIDRGQVASLLDCILLTAGPLHALADATQPARVSSAVLSEGPTIIPSSLLPIDVSVLLRGPHWIRIVYRRHFAVDMRCFAGDHVWLQPATPPKGGPSVGGSLPCPQFRQFIMELVAQELKDSNLFGGQQNIVHHLGDDGGYGGWWVPLAPLTKVLRGVLKYLGALWLFAQLPDILKEILGSILEVDEGALLNVDQDQPALRFYVQYYAFSISVHRAQLLLQMQTVNRFHRHEQQVSASREALNKSEIDEICDYFSRRVVSEPYIVSRVASFITLLTLPISVLREFVKLIAWKKRKLSTYAQVGNMASAQKSHVELCLGESTVQSNIHYDRALNSVDFMLTVVLDPAHIPHMNSAGGAAWLPYCVSVSLRYLFGGYPSVSFQGMEGSHGGRACWLTIEDWEICKERVARTVVVNGYSSAGQLSRGKLRIVAANVQRTLNSCLQELRDGASDAT